MRVIKGKSCKLDFEAIERRVEEKAKKRAQRRKELFEKDISTDVRIVAWIDVLGFSNELQKAKTKTELRAVYRKMLLVHDMFDLPSASDEPEEREEINKVYGRMVLALSDGLVVTASARAEAGAMMTPYDLLMSFIDEIITAQAQCALNGIFLRGGVSIGPFYYDNNILLSPALVRAYKLETERATYPVIIVNQSHIAALRKLRGIDHYSKEAEPSRLYFQPFKAPGQRKGERFFYLDYINFLSDPGVYGFFNEAERKAAFDRDRYSPEERDQILQESHIKSAARGMRRHKEKLIEGYLASNSEKVRKKYRWLMKHQNRTLKGYPATYAGALIDMNQFQPP